MQSPNYKNELNLALLQVDIVWQDKEKNFNKYEELLKTLTKQPDLVVLPEMFNTGFSMHVEKIAEDIEDSLSLGWMRSQAQKYQTAICGSLSIKENNKYYNRLYFVKPDQTFEYYDKRHLFSFAGEHLHYTPGKKRLIVDYLGWRICPLICYDLRFPVFSRNKFSDCKSDYDLLIYIANWPEKRAQAWNDLLKARSHENQCYTVGVNRIGKDPKLSYRGDSQIIDYQGSIISNKKENHLEQTIFKNKLEEFKAHFQTLRDADRFTLNQ